MGGKSSKKDEQIRNLILEKNKLEKERDEEKEKRKSTEKERDKEKKKRKNSEKERDIEEQKKNVYRKNFHKEKKRRKTIEEENEKNKKILKEIEEKDKEVLFPSPDKIKRSETYEDEIKTLLEAKKIVLQSQLRSINKALDKIKDINEMSEKFNNLEIDSLNNNFKIDSDNYCFCCEPKTYLKFNFEFIGLFFVIFYLIVLYQLLWINNSTYEEMIFGLKSFILRTNRTDYYPKDFDYEEKYKNNIFMNLPDFEFFKLSSIIGNLSLKCCGYTISLIVFIFLNTGAIFLFRIFNFPDSYDIYQLILFYSHNKFILMVLINFI